MVRSLGKTQIFSAQCNASVPQGQDTEYIACSFSILGLTSPVDLVQEWITNAKFQIILSPGYIDTMYMTEQQP